MYIGYIIGTHRDSRWDKQGKPGVGGDEGGSSYTRTVPKSASLSPVTACYQMYHAEDNGVIGILITVLICMAE
jgi:hypothetical protein